MVKYLSMTQFSDGESQQLVRDAVADTEIMVRQLADIVPEEVDRALVLIDRATLDGRIVENLMYLADIVLDTTPEQKKWFVLGAIAQARTRATFTDRFDPNPHRIGE